MFEKHSTVFVLVIKRLPEIVTYCAVGLLLFDDLVASIRSTPNVIPSDVRLSLIAVSLVGLVLTLQTRLHQLYSMVVKLQKRDDVEELLPSHEMLDIGSLVQKARNIRILSLSGTKLARLGETLILEELKKSDVRHRIVILLGDPFSEAIQMRYATDEPVHYETGLEGLQRRLFLLHEILTSLPEERRQYLDIRVFSNYPTCSIVQADDDVYCIIYGYQHRGSDCPKIHAHRGGAYTAFLLSHFDNVYKDSVPLSQWVETHKNE